MLKKKKKKKKSPAKLAAIERRKLLKNWADQIKMRDHHECVICGKGPERLNAHHLLPKAAKAFKLYQYDLNNGVSLCCFHHMFCSDKAAHTNGIWFTEWLKKYRPTQYKIAVNRLGEI